MVWRSERERKGERERERGGRKKEGMEINIISIAGNPVLPIQIGGLKVHDLGKVTQGTGLLVADCLSYLKNNKEAFP